MAGEETHSSKFLACSYQVINLLVAQMVIYLHYFFDWPYFKISVANLRGMFSLSSSFLSVVHNSLNTTSDCELLCIVVNLSGFVLLRHLGLPEKSSQRG